MMMTLVGMPKSGKTREALRRAVAAAKEGRRVLYINTKDTLPYLFSRLEELCGDKCPPGLAVSAATPDLEDYRRRGLQLLIFDAPELPDVAAALAGAGVEVLHVKRIAKREWRELGCPEGWKYR